MAREFHFDNVLCIIGNTCHWSMIIACTTSLPLHALVTSAKPFGRTVEIVDPLASDERPSSKEFQSVDQHSYCGMGIISLAETNVVEPVVGCSERDPPHLACIQHMS